MGSGCSSQATVEIDEQIVDIQASKPYCKGSSQSWLDADEISRRLSIKRTSHRILTTCDIYKLGDSDWSERPIAVLKITVEPCQKKRASISCISDLPPRIGSVGGMLKEPIICWGHLPIKQQIPKFLPPVLPEGTSHVYAILKKEIPEEATVTLYGVLGDEEVEISTHVTNDATMPLEEETKLTEFLQKNEAKKQRKKTKMLKKPTPRSSETVDAGYDSLTEQSANRMSSSSGDRKMSVKYGTNVRKFSVVGKRRTMSSTTIDNSFKEAYFTPQCVYIDDCELPEITRSRRDTPIYNRLNVEMNPLWRSNSDMLREDAEENVNLAVPKVRHRSDSVMVVTSLFGSNDGLIESCNDLEKVFTESPIKMIARDYSVLRNPARKRRLTVGVNSATKADCPTQGTCKPGRPQKQERARSLPLVEPDRLFEKL